MKRRSWESPEVNLTPLIDVVFVILIMFIVLAPLLEKERVELADSGGEHATPVRQKGELLIYVLADDSICLGKEKVSLDELRFRLKEEHIRFPNQIPQLFHDRKAHFGTYQNVKNCIESAGFSEIDLILNPT